MATIGSLAVSLSLDSTNFNNSVAQANRNLKAMGGELSAVKGLGDTYGSSVEGLTKRKDILSRAVETSSLKLQEQRKRYDELLESGKATDKQLETQAIAVNKAQAEYNRLSTELSGVSKQLDTQSSSWYQAGEKLKDVGGKMKSVGDSMTSVGKDLSAKVTLPIVGIGTSAVLTGVQFESAMAQVKAVTGATDAEMGKLEKTARELGETTRFSATEAADGMKFLGMAGFDASEIINAMPALLNLATVGVMDLGTASDIASNIMTGFGLDASEAGHMADVLAKASTGANTTVAQLGDGMKYLAPTARAMGWDLEEATAATMAFSDAGLQGSLGTRAFSTSLTRLADPTAAMAKEIKNLGIEFFDASGTLKSMPDMVAELERATEGMTDKQKAATLATLFGNEAYKQWEILLSEGSESLADTTVALVDSTGAAEGMAKTMSDTVGGAFTELKSMLSEAAIQLYEEMRPALMDLIDWVKGLVQSFLGLSSETKENIIKFAALAAAIGPVLVVAGSLISSIGGIITVAGAMSGSIAAAGGVIAALTGPVGIAVVAIAGLTAGGIALVKHLQSSSIEIEDWGDKVSDETRKAVGGFMELSDGAKMELDRLHWSGAEVTDQIAESITGKFNEMGTQIVEGMKIKHEEQLAAMSEFFANSKGLTEEEQRNIIAGMETHNQDQIQKVEEGTTRIEEILTTASKEKRGITQTESDEISKIREGMNTDAIKSLTANQREQKVIFETMKSEATEISAVQAAEVVKNAVEQKEKVVTEAQDQYEDVVANILALRDEAGSITAEQADALILEAARQRDGTVSEAEDMHAKIVEQAKLQAEEHVGEVDWETGEVLSKWEAFVAKNKERTDRQQQEQNEALQEMQDSFLDTWESIKNTVEEKWGAVRDFLSETWDTLKTTSKETFDGISKSISTTWDNVKTDVTEKWGQITSKIKGFIDEIKNFFTTLILKIPTPELPKLPSFALQTATIEILGKIITYPTGFSIAWHALGGIFDKPTLFATGAGMHGVGEAGPEAIIPLKPSVLAGIGRGIAEQMEYDDVRSAISSITASLADVADAMQATSTAITNIDNSRSANLTVNGGGNASPDLEQMMRRILFQL